MLTEKKNTQNVSLAILLATTFLPVTNIFNVIKIIIVFILCLNNKKHLYTSLWSTGKQIITIWLVGIILASLAVIAFEGGVNQITIIHETSRLIYYALVIYLCSKLSINLRFLFYCCVVVLSIHSVIQITQYLRLGIFDHYIETYYLMGNIENIHYQLATKNYYAFRSGSIFINPNVYVCYPYLSVGVFLEYYKRTKSWFPILMTIVAFVSVVLTGSRMGLVAFTVILGWYFIFGKKSDGNLPSKNYSISGPIFIVTILIISIFNWDKIASSADGMRAFSLDKAYASSGSTKIEGFVYYLTHADPIYWITGSLGNNSLNVQIDMEFGYIFAWFGIFGIIWYAKLLKLIHNTNSNFRVISTISVLAILLTAIGATSVLNMSVFPYICAISLTHIYDSSEDF